jgi:hypothetical protein
VDRTPAAGLGFFFALRPLPSVSDRGDATEFFPDITQAAPDLAWSAAISEPEPRARGIVGAVRHKLRESRSAFAGRGQRRGEHLTDSEAKSNARGYVGTKIAERMSEVLSHRRPVT